MLKELRRDIKDEVNYKIARFQNWLDNKLKPDAQMLEARDTIRDIRLGRDLDYPTLKLLIDIEDFRKRQGDLSAIDANKLRWAEVLLKITYGKEGREQVIKTFIEEKEKRQKKYPPING